MANKEMRGFFAASCKRGSMIELWIDHPNPGFHLQKGICLEANLDYLVIGPAGGPGRICIPYQAIRWFRDLEDQ